MRRKGSYFAVLSIDEEVCYKRLFQHKSFQDLRGNIASGNKLIRSIAAVCIMLFVAGCAPTAPPVASIPPEQLASLIKQSEVPAAISTVEFKELGDTRRFAVMSRLVAATWSPSCKVNFVAASGYSPSGHSIRAVRCAGTTMLRDYSISIPEKADGMARVLHCYRSAPNRETCDLTRDKT